MTVSDDADSVGIGTATRLPTWSLCASGGFSGAPPHVRRSGGPFAALDITRWNYKGEDPAVSHIGPTAQDFAALFNVGTDDKSISTIDPAGIALVAIHELGRRTRRIDALEVQVAELHRIIHDMARSAED